MCTFITLIIPSGDVAAIKPVMEQNNRAARAINNASLRTVLKANEQQYLTTRGFCDCGSVLGQQENVADADHDGDIQRMVTRLRRKKWPEAKIMRAVDDHRKTVTEQSDADGDNFELWQEILHSIGQDLKLPYVGLFVRFYAGDISTEIFKPSRHEVPRKTPWRDALAQMKPNEVTIFQL